ncbi:hypothetical protein M407DRAFT_31077 [Tulasnella calospora MUT 4182]|uniref:Chaperone DnaJ C-terminal domain-containing protein n=1 Tax=Tulasnella calospora MUT 4182 TaxID=1051891 RepID=A0A0C3Q692_9AGAM|nr:hypothetical protein M407DRAFT_31077 [Tulasnella calospora MUT 4182]
MALLARASQPPPSHNLGLQDIPDDGDALEQLLRAIFEDEPPQNDPSIAASSASNGRVGLLQVNKELPPLPSEDESDSSFHSPHEIPTRLPSQATGVDSPASKTISLSIYPPPSPKSRNSASSDTETCTSILNSNFGTSNTNSFADCSSAVAFTPSPYGSPLSRQPGHLPAESVEQSWSGPGDEVTSPSSPALQLVTQDHTPHKKKSPTETFGSLQASFITSWDRVSPGPERSPALPEKIPREPRQTWVVFDGDYDSSGFKTSSVVEDEPIVATLPTVRSSKSHPRRKRSLSGRPTPFVAPPPWQFLIPASPNYPLQGGTHAYQITTRLLSGEPKIQNVQIDVMPGWALGTQIIVPNAGNECAPGKFQTMIFVVEQIQHEKFTRLEGGKLEHDQDISLLDARKANGTRALREVVGLDGKVIKFYPPRGAILHGQETVIKGEGMYKRSNGKAVGRGDLIIRWNIKFP